MKHMFLGLVLATVVCGTAVAQELQVSGTVTSAAGQPLPGVTVQVRGTDTKTTTDATGKYSITAPGNGVLLYALIGYRGTARTIGGRSSINVALDPVVAVLEPVVVTGYQTLRRADTQGAASSANTEALARKPEVSVLQRLDGEVPGVTVENGGSPGSRTTVRVRGISSFQNNDPLIIVDGTPLQDSYLNFLNPAEIGSLTVLKDASAASIYGARANNGVIVIETKRGRPGGRNVTLEVRTGVSTPVRGYDDILIQNSLDYFKVVRTAYQNAGQATPTNIFGDSLNPQVPAYIWPNNCTPNPCASVDPSTYSYPNNLIMPGSAGTNWWKAVFGTGSYRDMNLAFTGAGEDNSYHVAFNYLDQMGTAAYSRQTRGGVRINTAFTQDRMRIGENISLSRQRGYGGLDDGSLGEGNIIGKNMMQQPVVPIYDIAGNFASGKAVGLSNLTNPLKVAWASQFNVNTSDRIFGNAFANYDATHGVTLQTRFGFNLGLNSFRGFSPIYPENSEPTFTNGVNENYNLFTEWTWTNTLNYVRHSGPHNVTLLLGQEAIKNTGRTEAGSCASLLSTDINSLYIQDALCDPTTKNVTSSGSRSTLLSFFGKADYNHADRYFFSVTLRRDGSSRLGPSHRWGTFPAVGLGWRVYNESFMPAKGFFSNAMLRLGWGVTGNQQIPPGRIISQLGGDRGDTFYDIGGSNTTIRPGYKVVATGNADLKWEENRSINAGVDLEALEGRAALTADVYRRNTNNLLFDPRLPATAGSAAPPIVNVGKMRNSGVDFSISYRSTVGPGTAWTVTFNGSHYRNKIVQIDGSSQFFFPRNIIRDQNPIINQVGYPIGSFYGLVADGFYKDTADALPYWSSGARPGRIKFKDLNGDGLITAADRAVIGSPHPDFTAGLDLGVRHGAWDFSATVFGSFGNQIFNEEKYWYVFRYFNTNVRKDLLTDSWTPTHQNAKYPRLDVNDVFSRQFSSYWVEDGSYVRLRALQVAYDLPPAFVRWIPAARVYVQVENLFTITGYSGLDPALPAASVFGAAGDTRDQYRGIDQGSYPSNRTFTIGFITTF
jgi:TonB-dependent starch-binding outer membrane protein SusC